MPRMLEDGSLEQITPFDISLRALPLFPRSLAVYAAGRGRNAKNEPTLTAHHVRIIVRAFDLIRDRHAHHANDQSAPQELRALSSFIVDRLETRESLLALLNTFRKAHQDAQIDRLVQSRILRVLALLLSASMKRADNNGGGGFSQQLDLASNSLATKFCVDAAAQFDALWDHKPRLFQQRDGRFIFMCYAFPCGDAFHFCGSIFAASPGQCYPVEFNFPPWHRPCGRYYSQEGRLYVQFDQRGDGIVIEECVVSVTFHDPATSLAHAGHMDTLAKNHHARKVLTERLGFESPEEEDIRWYLEKARCTAQIAMLQRCHGRTHPQYPFAVSNVHVLVEELHSLSQAIHSLSITLTPTLFGFAHGVIPFTFPPAVSDADHSLQRAHWGFESGVAGCQEILDEATQAVAVEMLQGCTDVLKDMDELEMKALLARNSDLVQRVINAVHGGLRRQRQMTQDVHDILSQVVNAAWHEIQVRKEWRHRENWVAQQAREKHAKKNKRKRELKLARAKGKHDVELAVQELEHKTQQYQQCARSVHKLDHAGLIDRSGFESNEAAVGPTVQFLNPPRSKVRSPGHNWRPLHDAVPRGINWSARLDDASARDYNADLKNQEEQNLQRAVRESLRDVGCDARVCADRHVQAKNPLRVQGAAVEEDGVVSLLSRATAPSQCHLRHCLLPDTEVLLASGTACPVVDSEGQMIWCAGAPLQPPQPARVRRVRKFHHGDWDIVQIFVQRAGGLVLAAETTTCHPLPACRLGDSCPLLAPPTAEFAVVDAGDLQPSGGLAVYLDAGEIGIPITTRCVRLISRPASPRTRSTTPVELEVDSDDADGFGKAIFVRAHGQGGPFVAVYGRTLPQEWSLSSRSGFLTLGIIEAHRPSSRPRSSSWPRDANASACESRIPVQGLNPTGLGDSSAASSVSSAVGSLCTGSSPPESASDSDAMIRIGPHTDPGVASLQDSRPPSEVEPSRRGSAGSVGHPSACARPCTFERRAPGRCRYAAFCLFCHGAHMRRQRLHARAEPAGPSFATEIPRGFTEEAFETRCFAPWET